MDRPSFRNIWRIYHTSMYFFWKRSSFIFRLKNNIISSGKRNIIFLDDTREIIFQCYFFGKTIFSEHFGKRKHGFSCSVMTSVLRRGSAELLIRARWVIVLMSTSSLIVFGLPITGETYSPVLAIDSIRQIRCFSYEKIDSLF